MRGGSLIGAFALFLGLVALGHYLTGSVVVALIGSLVFLALLVGYALDGSRD